MRDGHLRAARRCAARAQGRVGCTRAQRKLPLRSFDVQLAGSRRVGFGHSAARGFADTTERRPRCAGQTHLHSWPNVDDVAY